MGSTVLQYESRLRNLLENFLQPDYSITNDAYLNTLLSHLSGKNNEQFGKQLLDCPYFMEWLLTAISQWESSLKSPTPSISSFTLHLTGLLSQNESRFKVMNQQNAYVRLCTILKTRAPDTSPSIKLGYIKMLSSFINHKIGIEWLIATDYWQDALTYCLANQTVYIVREGHNFVMQLLSNGINYNEVFSELVIKRVLSVVTENHFSGSVFPEINDSYLKKCLGPTLQLITYVLEKVMESDAFKQGDYRVGNLLIKKYNIEHDFWNLFMMAHEEDFLFDIARILILIYFIQMVIDKEEEYIVTKEVRAMCSNVFKALQVLNSKRSAIAILKICHYSQVYWNNVKHNVRQEEGDGNRIYFENQLVVLQILPLFVISYYQGFSINMPLDEFRESYIAKLFKISCENTVRMAYAFRTVLFTNEKSIYDNAQKGVAYLMKTKQYLDRSRAVIVSQAMMFVMKDITCNLKNNKERAVVMFTKYSNLMCNLIDGLATLIVDFDITWRESIETICIFSLSMEFLNSPHSLSSSKLIIQTLKLIKLSISRFMTPNQVLLIDSTADSSLALLGPMLYSKLHDNSWEVRDSVLEVLYTIAEISNSKFPAFQKTIKDANLCSLVVTMATDDQESYVRASALKCLSTMIRVSTLWDECLADKNLPEKVLAIIKTETEGTVRCQAAELMCSIYGYQGIDENLMESVYSTMHFAATADLHWEVKLSALCFWHKVIKTLLRNQGMIDNAFPNVTFSKEHRKIVTLTEIEIQNRLKKVLNQLSTCGCLNALVVCMEDDCDLEVAKKAVSIVKELASLLEKHNVLTEIEENGSCSTSSAGTSAERTQSASSFPEPMSSDDVIDSIVNAKDISLLADVIKPETGAPLTNGETKQQVSITTPEAFECFIGKDLDQMINERKRWLESVDDLGSLLDDMLKTYEDNDINSMDCY